MYSESADSEVVDAGDFAYVHSTYGSTQINKSQYGSLLILKSDSTITEKGGLKEYEIVKFRNSKAAYVDTPALVESTVIQLYAKLLKQTNTSIPKPRARRTKSTVNLRALSAEKRGHIKHIVRMRYRWFFQPKLSQFKLFKKFFKRVVRRYRKINKNKLFISKFRAHFPKLTGFTEKGLLKL